MSLTELIDLFTVYDAVLAGGQTRLKYNYSECTGFWPTWNCYNSATLRGGFPTFATTLNSFIDIIHSTENKAIKEGTTSVNSNYKSSHVAPNFVVICIMLIRRVCMKSTVVYGRYNLSLFFTLHENNLSTNVFRCGSPPLCSGVIAVPSGPKSHTFTVILAAFAP